MAYVNPKTVTSPKSRITGEPHHIYEDPKKTWAVAELIWDGDEMLGIRWSDVPECEHGMPTSFGHPAWFIIPTELQQAVREQIKLLEKTDDGTAPPV